VKVVATGYRESSQVVEVKLGDTQKLTFTLELVPVIPQKPPGLMSKWWFWGAVGAGVIGGVVVGVLAGKNTEKAPPLPDGTAKVPAMP